MKENVHIILIFTIILIRLYHVNMGNPCGCDELDLAYDLQVYEPGHHLHELILQQGFKITPSLKLLKIYLKLLKL